MNVQYERFGLWDRASPHHAVPLAVSPQRLHQVFLAAEAEVLDGLGDAPQRAVDLLRVQVLAVVLQHAAARDKQGQTRES